MLAFPQTHREARCSTPAPFEEGSKPAEGQLLPKLALDPAALEELARRFPQAGVVELTALLIAASSPSCFQ
jgi:hypothetical protein